MDAGQDGAQEPLNESTFSAMLHPRSWRIFLDLYPIARYDMPSQHTYKVGHTLEAVMSAKL